MRFCQIEVCLVVTEPDSEKVMEKLNELIDSLVLENTPVLESEILSELVCEPQSVDEMLRQAKKQA